MSWFDKVKVIDSTVLKTHKEGVPRSDKKCLCGRKLTILKTLATGEVVSRLPRIQSYTCYNKDCGLYMVIQLKID